MDQKILGTVLIVILIIINGCAQNIAVNSFCLTYNPVYFSDKDTEETIKQVTLNNAIYDDLCTD